MTTTHGVSILEPQARLAVRCVEDLVGLVPYLIGFHPTESLVAMVIEDSQVVVTARVDLVAVTERGVLGDLVTRLFDRFPRAEGWFFAFTDEHDLAWSTLGECAALVGVTRLGRVLQVGRESWRADHPDGATGSLDRATSAVAAQAAVLGMPARASRQALAESITGPPDTEIDELVRVFDEEAAALAGLTPGGRGRRLRRLLRGRQPDLRDQAQLALLVAEGDGMLTVLRELSRETADDQLALFTGVVRHSLLSHQAMPLGLLGMAAWQAGDGALQMVCLERLDLLDPELPLAGILEWLNHEVLPPGEWPVLRRPLLSLLSEGATGRFPPLRAPGSPASPRSR